MRFGRMNKMSTWIVSAALCLLSVGLATPRVQAQDHPAANQPKAAASAPSEASPVDAAGRLIPGQYAKQINGLRLWFKIAGKGPVCILPTPGWGPSSDLYINSIGKLEEMMTVVYFDTRASGRSQAPSQPTELTRANLESDLDQLREWLKQDKVWIFGHSTGTVLALQYALDYPQHVAGLVLVGAALATDEKARDAANKQADRIMKEPWFPIAMKAMQADVARMKLPTAFKASVMGELPVYFHDQEKLRDVRSIFDQTDYSLLAAQGMMASNPVPLNLEPRLPEIKSPTIVMTGASDINASPYQANIVHTGIKGSKMFIIPEAGHFPWMEQPDKFFAALKEGLAAVR